MNPSVRWKRLVSSPWLAETLAGLGAALFALQIWVYAHTQTSILDEGAYLLKGYFFAIGRYTPYQDYGFWTNHMPFSFLIPGIVQRIFGPGLRTGRYFAVFLGLLMLLGIWWLARRIGGRWWAAGAVGLFAFNVQLIKVYSVMASQGLVACMLVWVLVLTLGNQRRLWQLLLGTALAVLVVLTRINMAPLLPLLILYILWENGWRVGLWSFAVGMLTFVGGHAFFWPEILHMWASWLPVGLFPFLEPWARPAAIPNWQPETSFSDRILSFFQAIRLHYFSTVGALTTLILWPRKSQWKSAWRMRAATFLVALFMLLWAFHAWASLGKNYCVYCLDAYISFFAILGVLLVIVAASSWRGARMRWLPAGLIFCLSAGISFGLIPIFGSKLISNRFVYRLMQVDVPRIKSFRIQTGTTELWGYFANKFAISETQVVEYAIDLLRIVGFVSLGLLAGWLIWRFGEKLGRGLFQGETISPVVARLTALLLVGTLITLLVGLTPYDRDCGGDVIASYEAGGARLAEVVPAGAKVYWWGGLSAVPLLYIPEAQIYPAQINDGYSYRLSGDADELERFGWWSEELAEKWLQEADVILIEARQYGGFATSFAESGAFDETSPTPPMIPCRANSPIHIFVRTE